MPLEQFLQVGSHVRKDWIGEPSWCICADWGPLIYWHQRPFLAPSPVRKKQWLGFCAATLPIRASSRRFRRSWAGTCGMPGCSKPILWPTTSGRRPDWRGWRTLRLNHFIALDGFPGRSLPHRSRWKSSSDVWQHRRRRPMIWAARSCMKLFRPSRNAGRLAMPLTWRPFGNGRRICGNYVPCRSSPRSQDAGRQTHETAPQ